MRIEKFEFDLWLNEAMTVNFIKFLKDSLLEARRDLSDSNFLMEPNNDKEIGYKAGYKDCIQYLLLTVFQQEEETQDEISEHSPTIWSQSTSETKEDGARKRD